MCTIAVCVVSTPPCPPEGSAPVTAPRVPPTLDFARDTPQVPAPAGGAPHIHFRRHRELFGLQHAFFALQEREYTPEDLGPEIPQLVNGLNAAFRPYYFHFDEDRERAVARMSARSEQVEPAGWSAGRVQ